ncbi:DUF3352 domain-containing protein [Nocardioides sp. LHG3406-4]|uniref:DUF3352 domain-containing protein n=1 Tax=Nocardioides sp. LHG3406-4 TaxID=2804575 RepID=UPI003CF5BE4F
MSDQFPPQGPQGPQDPQGQPPQGQPPYGQPPQGQPPYGQPPQGQPPYGQPGYGQPEYLASGSGQPVGPAPAGSSGGGKKKAIIAGAVLGGLVVVGGAAYGISTFMSAGAQAAEALPAGTVGYASINLDPSGSQKIEALKTLRKFPAFRDEVGLQTDDDLRKRFFEELQKSGACESIDYDQDVKPWLGDRMAFAAVDTGDDQPHPVGVIEVKDAGKAEDGFAKLQECGESATTEEGGDGAPTGGYKIEGDWAILAETDEIAGQVVDAAADKSLADDESYKRWIDEAGDAGIVSMYAAPAAGEYFASQLGTLEDQVGALSGVDSEAEAPPVPRDELIEMGFTDDEIDEMYGDMGATDAETPAPSVPPEVTDALKDFEGAAATIRFDDGALEFEVAGDVGKQADTLSGSDRGGDAVETLPEDTLAAVGVGFADDWFSSAIDRFSSMSGSEVDVESMIADLEAQTGLSFPEDAETLVGDSVAIAVGSDIDPEAIFNGGGPADIPVGVKIKGDPDEIEAVLAKITPQLGEQASLLETEAKGDYLAVGPNADYRAKLAEDGGLGSTEAYQDVIEESDKAGALLFVNFDANGDWLKSLSGDDPSIAENVEPLSAFGISGWVEDGVSHGLVKLTTD